MSSDLVRYGQIAQRVPIQDICARIVDDHIWTELPQRLCQVPARTNMYISLLFIIPTIFCVIISNG